MCRNCCCCPNRDRFLQFLSTRGDVEWSAANILQSTFDCSEKQIKPSFFEVVCMYICKCVCECACLRVFVWIDANRSDGRRIAYVDSVRNWPRRPPVTWTTFKYNRQDIRQFPSCVSLCPIWQSPQLPFVAHNTGDGDTSHFLPRPLMPNPVLAILGSITYRGQT